MNRKLRAYSYYQEYLFLIANDLQMNVTKMNIVNDFLTSFNNNYFSKYDFFCDDFSIGWLISTRSFGGTSL
jgi:hypothetical protein